MKERNFAPAVFVMPEMTVERMTAEDIITTSGIELPADEFAKSEDPE